MKIHTFLRVYSVVLALALLAACTSQNPAAEATVNTTTPTPDAHAVPAQPAADSAPLVSEAPTVPADFESRADADNQQLAPALYEALPFADETMPADSEALRSALSAVGTCKNPPNPIDTTSFPYPVLACRPSEQGYPVYQIKCNLKTRECINLVDRRPIGTVEEVAPKLTVVANTDVLREEFTCDRICIDDQNRVVGAVQPEMQAWLDSKSKGPA